jgi:hypothetical protein
MPDPQELIKVLDMAQLDPTVAENKPLIELATWYYDRYLPVVIGKAYWNLKIRSQHLLTDKTLILGKEKVYVTITGEAFGLLILENYNGRWQASFEWQKDDESKPIPNSKDDPHIENFKAKWTDSKNGQVKYGGWNEAAFDRFQHYQEEILNERREDAKNDKAGQKAARELVRQKHNISTQETGKGKRRTKQAAAPKQPKAKKLKKIVE